MAIYYFCPDTNIPIGGVKVLYRHVEILAETKSDVYILHSKKEFRCTWFQHKAPIAYAPKRKFYKHDIIVFPESFLDFIVEKQVSLSDTYHYYIRKRKTDIFWFKKLWHTDTRRVLFVQNAYYLLDALHKNGQAKYLIDQISKQVEAIWCVSFQNQTILQTLFPKTFRIRVIAPSLNKHVFSYVPAEQKMQLITYMSRKNKDHANRLIAMVQVRNNLADFLIEDLQNLSETQIADKLKKSMFFLSFVYPEGFGLPPAEAAACGNIVIGYNGGGGKDYFNHEGFVNVEFGDIISYCEAVEKTIEYFTNHMHEYKQISQNISQYILEKYNADKEKNTLLMAWEELLNG